MEWFAFLSLTPCCWGVTYLILSVLLNSAGDIMMANSTTRLAVDE